MDYDDGYDDDDDEVLSVFLPKRYSAVIKES